MDWMHYNELNEDGEYEEVIDILEMSLTQTRKMREKIPMETSSLLPISTSIGKCILLDTDTLSIDDIVDIGEKNNCDCICVKKLNALELQFVDVIDNYDYILYVNKNTEVEAIIELIIKEMMIQLGTISISKEDTSLALKTLLSMNE